MKFLFLSLFSHMSFTTHNIIFIKDFMSSWNLSLLIWSCLIIDFNISFHLSMMFIWISFNSYHLLHHLFVILIIKVSFLSSLLSSSLSEILLTCDLLIICNFYSFMNNLLSCIALEFNIDLSINSYSIWSLAILNSILMLFLSSHKSLNFIIESLNFLFIFVN